MSRVGHPRRYAALAALIAAAFATNAAAQIGIGGATPGNRISLGSASAEACATAVRRNDLADRTLMQCDRALNDTQLPRNVQINTLLNRGALHTLRREFDAALRDFDAVIEVDPNNSAAYLSRGATLLSLNRHGEAVAALTEALGRGAEEAYKAYYYRAAAREALGDTRGAYEDYNTALEIHPNWAPAEAELARFARIRRDHLAEALRDDPPR